MDRSLDLMCAGSNTRAEAFVSDPFIFFRRLLIPPSKGLATSQPSVRRPRSTSRPDQRRAPGPRIEGRRVNEMLSGERNGIRGPVARKRRSYGSAGHPPQCRHADRAEHTGREYTRNGAIAKMGVHPHTDGGRSYGHERMPRKRRPRARPGSCGHLAARACAIRHDNDRTQCTLPYLVRVRRCAPSPGITVRQRPAHARPRSTKTQTRP